MNARTSLVTMLLVPTLTLAQVEEWNTFPTEATGDATNAFVAEDEPHSPSTAGNLWNARGNSRIAPGLLGANGLLHTSGAVLGPSRILRMGATGQYFTHEHFPVVNARNVRSAGTFGVSYVPAPWLEAYGAYGALTNTNSDSSPTVILTLGEMTLGAKATRAWAEGLHAGVDLRVQSFPAIGNQDLRHYAWGFAPRLIGTYDVRSANPDIPLLVHLNVGIHADTTGQLAGDRALTAVEEFAFGVNRYSRVVAAAAVEAPLPFGTPYLEYALGVPLGVPGGRLTTPEGSTASVAAAMPQTIGGGVRATALRDVTFTVGVDVGLARSIGLGVAATPPWNLYFGAAFNVDPVESRSWPFFDPVPERKLARIQGVILDARTRLPLPGAEVAVVGESTPPVASDAEAGHFITPETPPGLATIRAGKPGYKIATQQVMLQPGQTATVQLALERLTHPAQLLVSVTGARKKRLLVPADVNVVGPVTMSVRLAPEAKASRVDAPPGTYRITVLAADHLAQTRQVQVSENEEVRLPFELRPEPNRRLAAVKGNRIAILEQVQFAGRRATILALSYPLLDEVIDAIVRQNINRIRIEGHTDSRGDKQQNKEISEERARAVANYLVKQGIDPSRIETAGYGDTRAVAPNLTERGRAMNRRVEFVILER